MITASICLFCISLRSAVIRSLYIVLMRCDVCVLINVSFVVANVVKITMVAMWRNLKCVNWRVFLLFASRFFEEVVIFYHIELKM